MSGAHRIVSGALEESVSKLANFGFQLRYNSPDCPVHHRTVSGAPRESNSELTSFGFSLR